jgi:hypothetical protein
MCVLLSAACGNAIAPTPRATVTTSPRSAASNARPDTTVGTLKDPSEFGVDVHDAPDLEATLPAAVDGRQLVRWSVSGDNFWTLSGGDRAREAYGPDLATVGLSLEDITMAVAGRAESGHPPYIIWALRFGNLGGNALEGPVPLSLTVDVMHVDENREEENWREALVANRPVLVGTDSMVDQDEHTRGRPYLYVADRAVYGIISDDEEWANEAIAAMPPL